MAKDIDASQVVENLKKQQAYGPVDTNISQENLGAIRKEYAKEKPGFWNKYGGEVALAALPTIVGAAFGGDEGGAIGAKAGVDALKRVQKGKEQQAKLKLEEQKRLDKLSQQEQELAIKKSNLESLRRLRTAQEQYYKQTGQARLNKQSQEAQPKSFEEKVLDLGGENRKRLDNIRMGRQSLNDMTKALASGDNTFTLMGDNNFTSAALRWNEAIGRMQSGGAINKEEAANFRALVPSWADSREIQINKINKMREEMDRRLSTFGFQPTDVPGYMDPKQDVYMQAYAKDIPIMQVEQAMAEDDQINQNMPSIDQMTTEEINAMADMMEKSLGRK